MKRLALGLLVALVATACGGSASSVPSTERMKVVATAYPLFEAAGTVGGSRVHAINLLPLDPFGALTPSKAEQLRDASLAIVLGKGTQPAVDAVVAQRTGPTLRVLDGVPTLPSVPGEDVQPTDPYVWETGQNMGAIVTLVRAALSAADPDGATKFYNNAKNYGHMMAAIDRNYVRTIATCKRDAFVTEDPRFQYLAHRYGLEQVAVTSGTLGAAVDRYHPTTLFMRTLPSIDEARRLLSAYHLRAAVLDPLAAQTDQARRGGATYGVVMALNLDALRAALDCSSKPPPNK